MFLLEFEYSIELDEAQTKLHRELINILNDRTTLSFLVQFLESKNGLPLVKFYLDVESFKTVTCDNTSLAGSSRYLESQHSNYYDKTNLKRSVSCDGSETYREPDCVSLSNVSFADSNIDETDEIQSNVDESAIQTQSKHPSGKFDIEKLNLSLTDDEKSKICAKNRKNEEPVTDASSRSQNQSSALEDALRIYRRYLVTDSKYFVELPAMILSKLSLALCELDGVDDCDDNSTNLLKAFDEAQKHVLEVMENKYLAEFLESSFYYKYIVDVLTSEMLTLRDILYSESALFYFMEFLEQSKDECKLPYLEFWLSATNFRKQLNSESLDQIRDDALVIYEKWFSLQATNLLKFTDRIRRKVEEKICTIDVKVMTRCFDDAIRIVEIFLERNCFQKFIKSQLFFKFLAEVMSKIDGNHQPQSMNGVIRRSSSISLKFSTNNRHRRTNSDADRREMTRSISAQNTLLAGLDQKKSKNTTDLQIDSRQINNPDLLWRRKNSVNGLSFGRVDAYGRYERDFELPSSSHSITTSKSAFHLQNGYTDDPQVLLEQAKLSGTQSRLKNAMRKLVNLPEDSMQQEIAWQVAKLIVDEIQNSQRPDSEITLQ